MTGDMSILVIPIRKPEDLNIIIGHSHFIKTVEDLYEALAGTVPGGKFGIAFCEASGECLVRTEGNDEELKGIAVENALAIGAGHSFVIVLRDCYPINVLPAIRAVPEVCTIYCATANPLQVIVVQTALGRGIIGVIDGEVPKGTERPEDIRNRLDLLRKFGYKRG